MLQYITAPHPIPPTHTQINDRFFFIPILIQWWSHNDSVLPQVKSVVEVKNWLVTQHLPTRQGFFSYITIATS